MAAVLKKRVPGSKRRTPAQNENENAENQYQYIMISPEVNKHSQTVRNRVIPAVASPHGCVFIRSSIVPGSAGNDTAWRCGHVIRRERQRIPKSRRKKERSHRLPVPPIRMNTGLKGSDLMFVSYSGNDCVQASGAASPGMLMPGESFPDWIGMIKRISVFIDRPQEAKRSPYRHCCVHDGSALTCVEYVAYLAIVGG